MFCVILFYFMHTVFKYRNVGLLQLLAYDMLWKIQYVYVLVTQLSDCIRGEIFYGTLKLDECEILQLVFYLFLAGLKN